MTQDMQDNLENFVKNHKDEFDSLTPKEKVWEGIHNKLEESGRVNTKMIIWRAAAIILFIFSIGITFYANKGSIFKSEAPIAYDSEFLSTEKYYKSVINERQQLIVMVANTHPEIRSDFEADWKVLDQGYAKLKVEYSKNQSRDVLNALIQNLQSRANLLNKQIEILESINSDKSNILEI